MLCLIESPNASALEAAELLEMQRILDACPIEIAFLRSSAKQVRFAEAFFSRKHPDTAGRVSIFAALGGNRSGKSYVCGWLCFAKYLRDAARNGDWFWCVGQTLDRSIGGQQRELWQALPRWMFGDQIWQEKIGFGQHRKITLPTQDGGKCLVEFRSADQDASTFEQAKLTGVWCDERLPETIYNRLLPRIVDRDGWILYSDIPEQWWQFERLIEATPEAGVCYQHFAMNDNEPNLPPGAIAQASARMTADERAMRIEGKMVIMEGLIYKEFDEDRHVCKPFPIPRDWPRWRAIDYGSSAPTACGWFAIAPNEQIFLYREHYDAGHAVGYNARCILAASGEEPYVATYMDPHAVDKPPAVYGDSPTVSEQYAAAGITSTGWPYIQTMGEKAAVERVKFKLENRLLQVFDTCPNARREFRSWKHKLDKDGKPIAADAYENANNHLLDCIKGFIATNPVFTQRQAWLIR
jgi:hypothetical protein